MIRVLMGSAEAFAERSARRMKIRRIVAGLLEGGDPDEFLGRKDLQMEFARLPEDQGLEEALAKLVAGRED